MMQSADATNRGTRVSRRKQQFISAVVLIGVAVSLTGCGTSTSGSSSGPPDPYKGLPRYVNSRANLSPQLAEHYVDFSFSYPAGWELTPHGPTNPANYVRVTRRNEAGRSLKQFNVGCFFFKEAGADVWEQTRKAATALEKHFASQTDGYRKLSEGKTTFGKYDAYQFTFQHWLKNDKGVTVRMEGGGEVPDALRSLTGDTTLVVRVVLVPNDRGGEKNGAGIMMYSEEGLEGDHEMAVMVNSFRLGKD